MKIQQTAFMLMAITLFFVLVGLFFFSFQFAGLKKSAENLEEQNALLLLTKLANTPEFSCGQAYGTQKVSCVDADKLFGLIKNIDKYRRFWGVDNIEIRKLDGNSEILCSTQNYPDCNMFRLLSEEIKGFDNKIFVSLCRKDTIDGFSYNKCELAELSVSYTKND